MRFCVVCVRVRVYKKYGINVIHVHEIPGNSDLRFFLASIHFYAFTHSLRHSLSSR